MTPTSNPLAHDLALEPNQVGRSIPAEPLPSPHPLPLRAGERVRGEVSSAGPHSGSSPLPPLPSVKNSENSALVRAQLSVEVTPDSADSDVLHMRASDATLDRYKEVIVATGWRLENYLRNPVIQNAHQYGDIIFTIGRAEKTWVSGNALLQTWRFASNENPFAKIARDLYRGKFLQAASVGFIPIKWEDGSTSAGSAPASGAAERASRSESFRRRYTEQELIEVSAVGIPANPNALALALKAGAVEKSDLRELFALLKHLVGRDSVEPLDCGGSTPLSLPNDSRLNSELAELLPSLRVVHALLFKTQPTKTPNP